VKRRKLTVNFALPERPPSTPMYDFVHNTFDPNQERDSSGKWTTTGGGSFRDKQTESTAFKTWFGKSKVVDDAGKPLVVYHGTPEEFTSFDVDAGTNLGGFGKSGAFFSASPENAGSYAYHQPLAVKQAIKALETAEEERDEFLVRLGDKTGESPPSSRNGQRWLNAMLGEGKISREDYDKYGELDGKVYDLEHKELDDHEGKPNIHPVYLKIENPKIVDANGLSWDVIVPIHMESVDRSKHDGIIFKNIKDSGDWSEATSTSYVVFDSTQVKSATGNRGAFDPKDPNTTNVRSNA